MVILAVREGGFEREYVLGLPLPNLVALAKAITKAVYREQYEEAWWTFVASQCSQKDMEKLTKPWKRIAGIK